MQNCVMDLIRGVCFNEIYGESIMHPHDLETIKIPFVLEPQYLPDRNSTRRAGKKDRNQLPGLHQHTDLP